MVPPHTTTLGREAEQENFVSCGQQRETTQPNLKMTLYFRWRGRTCGALSSATKSAVYLAIIARVLYIYDVRGSS